MIVFFLVLNFLLLFFSFAFFFYRQSDKKRSEFILKEIRYQINRLIEELDSATDRDVTVLEDRLQEAKKTIKEMERKIRSIENLVQNREVLESLYDSISEQEVKKRGKKAVKRERVAAIADTTEGRDLSPLSAKRGIKKNVFAYKEQVLAQKNPSDWEEKANEDLSVREQVLLLKSKGFSNKKIANQLEISFDAVETILAMNFLTKKK